MKSSPGVDGIAVRTRKPAASHRALRLRCGLLAGSSHVVIDGYGEPRDPGQRRKPAHLSGVDDRPCRRAKTEHRCRQRGLDALADQEFAAGAHQGRQLDRAAAFQAESLAAPILLPSADNAVRWMPVGSSVMMSRTSATIAGRVPIPQGQRG